MCRSCYDMFHILRMNTGICLFFAIICNFVAEMPDFREQRHHNIAISVLQQYWFLATGIFFLSESFATFRAITGGIIGGKTWAYIPLGYGAPLIDVGMSLYFTADDYGTDPRAFLGWENNTKWYFFYGMWPAAFVRDKLL